MNIVMFTNTFTPITGGVARSVEAFTQEFRRRGHSVLVVAPKFPGMPMNEVDVVRIPAIQQFNGSDFSIVLPVSGLLNKVLDQFQPDIVHAHHPYLLGVTALRIARYREIPLVFTHHTRYEEYTHYVPGDSPRMRRFIIEASTRYANLADQVFSPSDSFRQLLLQRGVTTPIAVVPTGVQLEKFTHGNGAEVRASLGIPTDAQVIGHLGRLAAEKNLEFLTDAVASYMRSHRASHFLLIGTGPSKENIRKRFAELNLNQRLHCLGILESSQLTNALHAMSVFAFTSKSETQGMVLTEAMAAGLPVVAIDAPGVREVVMNYRNGRLLTEATRDSFVDGLKWVLNQPPEMRQKLSLSALQTAAEFSLDRCADEAFTCYENLKRQRQKQHSAAEEAQWHRVRELIGTEWKILKGIGRAAQIALSGDRES